MTAVQHAPISEGETYTPPTRADWQRLRLAAHRADITPLRYPGGKRKLAVLVAQIFALAQTRPQLLIEPFSGGGGVSLALLEAGFVDEIALADADEMVAAFWQTVFSEKAERLARMVEGSEISVEQRRCISASRPRSTLGLAFKCLYLNRTSFSGILKESAGMIGGNKQRGKYKIGCRFNRTRIAERIRELSKMRDRVRFVRCQSYEQTITDAMELDIVRSCPESIFWYFDPPFFEKASRLYRRTFNSDDHLAFKTWLTRVPGHYVLSYDDVAASERMYGDDKRLMRFGLQYTMNGDGQERPKVKEIILSDLTPSFQLKMTAYNRTYSILSAPIRSTRDRN